MVVTVTPMTPLVVPDGAAAGVAVADPDDEGRGALGPLEPGERAAARQRGRQLAARVGVGHPRAPVGIALDFDIRPRGLGAHSAPSG